MNGLLLINVGTPDAPTTPAVRRYLRQFLGDPRVLDIPAVPRWLLLNLVILPTRPAKSAAAYRQIWTEQGSPLLLHSQALAAAVQERLGESWKVEVGMRYGSPSVPAALARLREAGVERLVVLPMYPQYSSSATTTALEAVFASLSEQPVIPPVMTVEEFYDQPGFLDAFAAVGAPALEQAQPDYVLFSFHGLPERQVKATDPTGKHCLASADCCARISEANRHCYRAQCHATARALAGRLKLAPDSWSVSFQSRLGRTPWIQPFTDEVLPALAARGVKRLAVLCPAFVADCLETLEEIAIRAREDFKAMGGEELVLVPSLNASPRWADAVTELVRAQARRFAGPEL